MPEGGPRDRGVRRPVLPVLRASHDWAGQRATLVFVTTYLAPPRAADGRFADHPEIGLARRMTQQARMLLGYAPQEEPEEDEAALGGDPDDIEEMLSKQDGHPLNRGPLFEGKAHVVGRIAGAIENTIGVITFNPSEHPRDYRGRFLETGDDVDLPDGRRGVIESLNADGTMSVRSEGGVVSASAPEVRRVGDGGGIAVDLHDGRVGTADRTDPSTGDVVVRLPDNTETTTKPADLTPAPKPSDPTNITYGVDGQIIQGAGVRDAAGHLGIATSVTPDAVGVDFGNDHRTLRPSELTPTAGTPDSEFPSALDERLVNYKPSRNLADPTKVVPLAELLPEAQYQPYSQVPFLGDLHERMGVQDPLTHDVADYMDRRDELLNAQPLTSVPYDHVVVTQRVVNRDRVTQIAMDPSTGGTKPAHFVRYNGQTYVLNGHHRVAAQIINGEQSVMGRVLDLDRAAAEDPTIDPFHANGPDAAGLPTGIGAGAIVLTGAGHFAFITDASDAARMRAWDDDARQWVTLSVGDVGSVRVPNTDPEVENADRLMRARAKDAGLSRIKRPAQAGADLPVDAVHPRGALAPVDGVDGVESLGDGAVPRAAFNNLMFPEADAEPLALPGRLDPETLRRAAASRRAIAGIAPGLAGVPDDLMAELTNMPLDATYAITEIGGVVKVTDTVRERLAAQPGITMDVPGDDPRVAAYRRTELAGQYVNLWYQTSGDGNPRANAMQEVARDLFGLGQAESTSFNIFQDVNAHDVIAREAPAMRAFLAATYQQTQEFLAKAGVDSIVGYRGSSWRAGEEPDWARQPQTDAPLRPLSSWTASPTHAIKFEQNYGEDGDGVIRAATIPRDRILSIPSTGPGAFGENEIVVIAGPGTSTVVDPIGQAQQVAAGPIDETPTSPTWNTPGKPVADMPSRADMETPVWGEHTFAWQQWADFNLKDLPSTVGMDFHPDQLSPVPSTTHHLVSEDMRHEAKAQVVADIGHEMEQVPDEVMFRGVDDGFTATVDSNGEPLSLQAAVYKIPGVQGPPPKPVKVGSSLGYDSDYYDTVPLDDPRVREFRRGQVVNSMVAQWAQSSNDSSPESLAIQEIAAELFGITDHADWDLEYVGHGTYGGETVRAEIDQIKADRGEAITAFLQAQYDLTQRRYADAGIKEVTVYRGMGWAGQAPEIAPDWAQVDGDTTIALRPMSSWTLDRDTADQFGRNSGQGSSKQVNVVVGTTVPVERIIATPRTGVGALNEWEVVVLGGKLDVAVRTSVIPPMTEDEADRTPAGAIDREDDFQTAIRMASTQERRDALMERSRDRGGWAGFIPADWWPQNTGLSEDGLTFDGAKDEDSAERKAERMRRAAAMTIADIKAGTARDLYDAVSAEMYGEVYGISTGDQARRMELAAMLDSGMYSLPGAKLPDDWRHKP